jgi:hypothetical protein
MQPVLHDQIEEGPTTDIREVSKSTAFQTTQRVKTGDGVDLIKAEDVLFGNAKDGAKDVVLHPELRYQILT